ncbi:MAG: YigZ family protein [Flavobacteriaceae bacterium]|nr:YigZ family protein [Flavobacteriaceae bacterium]
MNFTCNTIAQPVVDVIFKEKGSKFIGYAYSVKNEEEIKKRLEEVKAMHASATHHCYAFRLGFSGKRYRANDDGEPNGTAGLPIYNQLLSNDLTYILLIVVRYYGGTKLGVSGLIKAYRQTAELTLNEAEIKVIEQTKKMTLNFPYSMQNIAMRLIERYDAELITQSYMEDCEHEIEIPRRNYMEFIRQLETHPDIEFWENK